MPLVIVITHAINAFCILLLIRSGLHILADHPMLYWTDHTRRDNYWIKFGKKNMPTDKLWTAHDEAEVSSHIFTLPGGGRVIREGGPGKRLEYDAHAVERGLRDAGAPPELIARVIERVTTIRVNGTEAQKAARANPTYKQVIDAATTRVDVPYTIRLG